MKPVIQCLPDAARQAARLAARLGIALHEIDVHRFPDDELRVTVGPAAPTTIIFVSLDQPNDKLLAILFAAEALRRGGATRLILVAPYLCYMRQDAAFHPGEAISQRVIGQLIARTVDRLITVDTHLHRTKNIATVFPGIEVDNLSAMPAIADYLISGGFDPGTIIAGPDAESEPWVRDLALRLKADYAVAQKIRHDDRLVEMVFADPAMFAGRPVLLVDDIVSSGGTILACAETLTAAGAKSVNAIVTHALFRPKSGAFVDGCLGSIISTDSVSHPSNAIELDSIFAEALCQELADASLPGARS